MLICAIEIFNIIIIIINIIIVIIIFKAYITMICLKWREYTYLQFQIALYFLRTLHTRL